MHDMAPRIIRLIIPAEIAVPHPARRDAHLCGHAQTRSVRLMPG